MGHTGWGWGSWVLLTVVIVIFWAAVVVLVSAAVRYLARRDSAVAPPLDSWQERARAEDLLAERFAHGDIDDDEYRRRLTLLLERH